MGLHTCRVEKFEIMIAGTPLMKRGKAIQKLAPLPVAPDTTNVFKRFKLVKQSFSRDRIPARMFSHLSPGKLVFMQIDTLLLYLAPAQPLD